MKMIDMKLVNQKGFTLIELLVVIAIIGLLASVVLVGLVTARERSRLTRANADIYQLAHAAEVLATDTGKWPGGCPAKGGEHPDMPINGPTNLAGFNSSPLVDTNAFIGITESPPLPEASNPYSIHYSSLSAGGTFPNHVSLCRWYPSEVQNWKGPYIQTSASAANDPWGTPYMFDMDYCIKDSVGVNHSYPAVVSFGPNKVKQDPCSNPTSDDVYKQLPGGEKT